ncbi:reverse transcriptase domain-containing protein [Tanacetum coccineum]
MSNITFVQPLNDVIKTSLNPNGDIGGSSVESYLNRSNASSLPTKNQTGSFADVVQCKCVKRVVKVKELRNSEQVDGAAVAIPMEAVEEVSSRFDNTLYGYFIGPKLAFPLVENYVKNTWAKFGLKRIQLQEEFFLFQFDTKEGMESVMENGPWLIRRIVEAIDEELHGGTKAKNASANEIRKGKHSLVFEWFLRINIGTRVILGWNHNDVDIVVINQDDQIIHIRVWLKLERKEFFCSFVYAQNIHSKAYCGRVLCFAITLYVRTGVGNLHTNVNLLHDQLDRVQMRLDMDPFNEAIREEEANTVVAFNETCLLEEIFLKQKAKIDCDGMVFKNENVATAFVSHYEAFLGQPGTTCGLNDNDLFCVILDQNVAIDMIRNVTRQELKNALFSMGNDKAPGPNGYTAAFFKESWDIVADDFVAAVCEFFTNGKILKELNHTIIALILKSAFVLGRSIADNTLLTQELMHNYHLDRGLPRCAFKVDIQKAYDTVDWDFLKKILAGFGFHTRMIGWIMECVTTTSFSISINVLTLMLQRGVRNASSFTYHRDLKLMEKSKLVLLIRKQAVIAAVIHFRSVIGSMHVDGIGRAKVAWEVVCLPKDEGGLGMAKPFCVSLVWSSIRPRNDKVNWFAVVWFAPCIPRHAFNLWLVVKQKLKTQDRVTWWDVSGSLLSVCPLCEVVPDQIMAYVSPFCCEKRPQKSVVTKLVIVATTYFIWQEHNWRLFKNKKRSSKQVFDAIFTAVHLKLLSSRFKKSKDGGFAAALALNKDPVWVMNVVPVKANVNTLEVIYERGLIRTYRNWYEAMSTYPRTYDFIHAGLANKTNTLVRFDGVGGDGWRRAPEKGRGGRGAWEASGSSGLGRSEEKEHILKLTGKPAGKVFRRRRGGRRSKDEAPEVIKTFLKKIQVLLQALVIIVRTENDTEFKNHVLKEYFDNVGIYNQSSSVRTPQQNGVMERRNQMLVEATRTMLIFSRSPLFLWAEAIATACYTQNCSIIHCRFDKTPYELINGRKLDISFLHVFRDLCYPKNDREDIEKLVQKVTLVFSLVIMLIPVLTEFITKGQRKSWRH